METIEKRDRLIKPGTLKPSPDLRRSLSAIELCENLFVRGSYIEYLELLNETYLGGQGTVEGPKPYISSDPAENSSLEDKRFIELHESWAGVQATLEWQESVDEAETKQLISLTVSYQSAHGFDNHLVSLYAKSAMTRDNDPSTSIGKSIQRDFMLSTDLHFQDLHILDDLLLEFTGELLESGMI